jgi:hypothetical protein
MKIYKLLIMAVAVLGFTACSDDDDFNTASGVTVSMESSTMTVRESRGLFKVPVVVTGDANGPIKVTVKVEEVGENPAMENVHYIVTQETVNIPDTEKSVGIEIKTVDNTEENDPREFKVTIVSAQGAEIGSDASTLITIKDDDADPYVKLIGTWNFTCLVKGKTETSYTLTMEAPDPDDSYYGKELYATGLLGYYYMYIPFSYKGDEDTGEFTLSIALDEFMCDYTLNFGSFTGVLISGSLDENNNYITSGNIPCAVNDDFTEITCDPNDYLMMLVYEYSGGVQGLKGYYTYFTDMSFEKVQ